MTNQDPAEFIPAIAERGRPEHDRSFAGPGKAGAFAGSLNESFLLVTAWSGGTVSEIAHVYCHDPGRPRVSIATWNGPGCSKLELTHPSGSSGSPVQG